MAKKQREFMKKWFLIAVFGGFSLGVTASAVAAESNVETSFNTLKNAVYTQDNVTIESYVTKNSVSMVNRLTAYNLNSCLPRDLAYAGESYEGDYAYITVETSYIEDKVLTSKLAFLYEGNRWKLDMPESFRYGLGENWEATLTQIESLYLAIKTQFGEVVNCTMVQNLVKNNAS